MKSIIKGLLLIGILIHCSMLNAQTWNISTGFDATWTMLAPGGIDAHWTLVQKPGSGAITAAAYATNGSLQNWPNANIDWTSWGTPPNCGRWLCPGVTPTGAGNYYEAVSNPQIILANYIFMSFVLTIQIVAS